MRRGADRSVSPAPHSVHRTRLLLPLLVAPACLTEPTHLPRVDLPAGVSVVVEGVPGTNQEVIPVYVRPDLPVDGTARNFAGKPGWVEVRSATNRHFPFVVAHEYVHASLGPDWSSLPEIVEEALCTRLAKRFAPEETFETIAEHFESLLLEVRLSTYSQPYDVDWSHLPDRSWYRDPTPGHMIALGVAHAIANRIPVETLHQLCLQATAEGYEQIPDEWLLRRAEPVNSDKTGPARIEEIVLRWLQDQGPAD